jgi:hypothetical protein
MLWFKMTDSAPHSRVKLDWETGNKDYVEYNSNSADEIKLINTSTMIWMPVLLQNSYVET